MRRKTIEKMIMTYAEFFNREHFKRSMRAYKEHKREMEKKLEAQWQEAQLLLEADKVATA